MITKGGVRAALVKAVRYLAKRGFTPEQIIESLSEEARAAAKRDGWRDSELAMTIGEYHADVPTIVENLDAELAAIAASKVGAEIISLDQERWRRRKR